MLSILSVVVSGMSIFSRKRRQIGTAEEVGQLSDANW
jgi:hypothetical protein